MLKLKQVLLQVVDVCTSTSDHKFPNAESKEQLNPGDLDDNLPEWFISCQNGYLNPASVQTSNIYRWAAAQAQTSLVHQGTQVVQRSIRCCQSKFLFRSSNLRCLPKGNRNPRRRRNLKLNLECKQFFFLPRAPDQKRVRSALLIFVTLTSLKGLNQTTAFDVWVGNFFSWWNCCPSIQINSWGYKISQTFYQKFPWNRTEHHEHRKGGQKSPGKEGQTNQAKRKARRRRNQAATATTIAATHSHSKRRGENTQLM